MRIVVLGRYNESETLSGPEKVAKRLFHHIYFLNNEITFVDYFFKYSNNKTNLFLRLFGKIIVEKNPNVVRFGVFRLLYYLVLHQPDIIHFVTSERFLITIFLYKFLLKGKIIITKHSIIKYEYLHSKAKSLTLARMKDLFNEWCELKFSDRLIFLTTDEINLAQSFYTFNLSKIVIIPNGIDREFHLAEKTGYNAEKIKLVFYSGFDDSIDRGIDFVYTAVNDIVGKSKIELYIIGRNLEQKNNHEYGFNTFFVEIMDQEKLINFLLDKDLIIKSNTFDSFPLFVCECMAMGIVPVISNNVGCKNYIKNNVNGYVYNSCDRKEFTKILSELIMNRKEIIRLSANCKNTYNELKWDRISNLYFNAYSFSNET